MLFDGFPFVGSDSYVLIGEIVERDEPEHDATHLDPPPRMSIRVAAAIGLDTVEAVESVDNDPTWGWDWPVGEQRLFVVRHGAGRPPELDVCHPGIAVDDPDALAGDLEPLAAASGTPFAVPDTTPLGSGHGSAVAATAATLAIVVFVVSRVR